MNFSITPVVRNLIMINLLVFAVSNLVTPLVNIFGLHFILNKDFFIFQFATYMFFHADFMHLFFNMLTLFFFGPILERYWGGQKFLIFFLVTGLGAAVLYAGITYYEVYQVNSIMAEFITNPSPKIFSDFLHSESPSMYSLNLQFMEAFKDNPDNKDYIKQCIDIMNMIYIQKSSTYMIGASGAVMGVIMAFGLTFPDSEMYIFPIPIAVKAKYYIFFYGLMEIYAGVRVSEGDNVAHVAHIGGMLMAFILLKIQKK